MGRNTNKKCLNMRDETLAIKSNKNWWKIFISSNQVYFVTLLSVAPRLATVIFYIAIKKQ